MKLKLNVGRLSDDAPCRCFVSFHFESLNDRLIFITPFLTRDQSAERFNAPTSAGVVVVKFTL